MSSVVVWHECKPTSSCEICNTEWWYHWLQAWLEIGWHARIEILATLHNNGKYWYEGEWR